MLQSVNNILSTMSNLQQKLINHTKKQASLMAQWVKDSPSVQETQEMWVRSLGWEDSLEEVATHPSILA